MDEVVDKIEETLDSVLFLVLKVWCDFNLAAYSLVSFAADSNPQLVLLAEPYYVLTSVGMPFMVVYLDSPFCLLAP